jgi:tRNA isopentenyl-2-thiomethyl-A-37 hydroxylase MiaE
MLTMALIEARSCERFKRLSEGLNDTYMKKFYRRFMESEAGTIIRCLLTWQKPMLTKKK